MIWPNFILITTLSRNGTSNLKNAVKTRQGRAVYALKLYNFRTMYKLGKT